MSSPEGPSTKMANMGDKIVIAGIAGRFPESAHLQEFAENLLNNVNMVTVNDRRFKPGIYGIPEGFGTLKEIDKFDADAFGILPNQARRIDPQLRMTLETVYEALCDAGVNPAEERGSRTGVFVGLCGPESASIWSSQLNLITDGLTLIGCSNSMFANRISFAFDFKGPSCAYDTACSTSIFALEAAVSAMRAGKCDSAIVTASTLVLTPAINLQFNKLGMLSKDSKCKSFDETGDGFVRAETVATIYLQKSSAARRAYASIIHIKTNTDGYKDNGITYPSASMQEELLRETYIEAGINVEEVTYVEAHGTGTTVGDPQELLALSNIFRSREKPLLIGSVKSNMGHAEGASGLCSIAKIITMLQTGLIPANLHYNKPSLEMNCLLTGQMEVVDKNTEWQGGYIGVNSFGFGGVNTHFILKPFKKEYKLDKNEELNFIPKLITFSGRNESGVSEALKSITKSNDANLILLVNEINKCATPTNTSRGFSILKEHHSSEDDSDILQIENAPLTRPPLWFVFNGIGSQWIGMSQALLQLPIFAKSIENSAKTLRAHFSFDLMEILYSTDSKIYDNATNCFVGIAASQIGLVDVLLSMGVRPDGFLGHSAGEMVCAYLDECLTAEETIICAYLRGESLSANNNNNGNSCDDDDDEPEPGAMAVVGLPWTQLSKLCPAGVYPACHNGIDSVTVAGSKSLITSFVQQLKEKKKGVKEVASCGIAFHSPYIQQQSKDFLYLLQAFIKSAPKARSKHWISTSIPESHWDSELHATASPEYFVNNFTSPVLFYEGLLHVPENAVIVEIGPSGLLRGLIKKTCPASVVIPLQARDSKQGLLDFVMGLGKLFLSGMNFDVNKLIVGEEDMKKDMFPVPLGTPYISPLIAWDHSTSWDVPVFGMNGELQNGIFNIDVSTEADSYLTGHVVHGRILFPATGYLFLVWKQFSQIHQTHFESFPIIFENVKLNRVTVLGTRGKVEFRLLISDVSGAFEIKEGGAVVASGTVRTPCKNGIAFEVRIGDAEFSEIETVQLGKLNSSQEFHLEKHDIYKRFRLYGFEYKGLFRGIEKCDQSGQAYSVNWQANNWVSFLDTFLQTCIPLFEQPNTKLPTAVTKLVIDPTAFLESVSRVPAGIDKTKSSDSKCPNVLIYKDEALGLIKCHGIEMHWPKTTQIHRNKKKEMEPVIFKTQFTPYFDNEGEIQPAEASPTIQCLTIIMENAGSRTDQSAFTLIELTEAVSPTELESLAVSNIVQLHFGTSEVNYTVFTQQNADEFASAFANSNIIVKGYDNFQKEAGWMEKRFDVIILDNHLFLHMALDFLKKGSFLLLKSEKDAMSRERMLEKIGPKFSLVAVKRSKTHVVYLVRKNTKPSKQSPIIVPISSADLNWIPTVQSALQTQEKLMSESGNDSPLPTVFLASNKTEEGDSGILGFTRCLRREPCTQKFRAILSSEEYVDFDSENPNPALSTLLAHDLAINVFDENGRWGFYSQIPIPFKSAKKRVESAFVKMGNIGDLTTFHWVEGFNYKKMGSPFFTKNCLPIDVHFAALNFKDVMLATGNLQPEKQQMTTTESPIGFEFSGKTTSGQRICGFTNGQALATQVLGFQDQLWEIPEHWSFAEAATVPVAYATVYMALVVRGQIQQGESILIHAGAGGVGQAAIRIALSFNCTIFTTVGSSDKKLFISKEFPQIPEAHIGNSRDLSFENMVFRETKGRGVDLVLNSLSGEKLDASIRCLARHGRFLEIGKFDLVSNKSLGMDLFLKDASFHGVMLDSLWDSKPGVVAQLKQLVQDGIERGVVQPLPSRIFQIDSIEPAFRFMGTGKHIGKVLIQVRKEIDYSDETLLIDATPQIYFHPDKSYIIVGGLGGIGLEFVNWMTRRKATKLVITSRSGLKSAYQDQYVRLWKENGVEVKILTLDASNMEEAKSLIEEATSMGPVGGFFNLALELKLGFMESQTEDSFLAVMRPKVILTRNMDEITRRCCPELNHFVVFSSIIAGVGLPGQCNYGLANSGAERICEKRAREGLPGKALELGPISDVGFFHENYNSNHELESYYGLGIQSMESVLKCMDILLSDPSPLVLSRVELEGKEKLKENSSLSLIERLGHILGTDLSKINPKTKLTELGMDSVMSMEAKQVLEQDFGIHLSGTEVRTVTLEQLTQLSKNSDKNDITPGRIKTPRKAATADLFQFNFMKNVKKTKVLYKQCVHPLNQLSDDDGEGGRRGTVFICNSIEGPDILRILGTLIKYPAYSMQFPEDGNLNDLNLLVDYYFKELKATVPNGPYIIVGYSGGTFIAIELAFRLQTAGEISKLVLLDLTPGRADAIYEENFGSERDSLEETDIMIVTLSQVFNIEKSYLEQLLSGLPDKDTKLAKAMEIGSALFDEPVDSKLFRKMISEAQVLIINLFNNYKPKDVYNGKIVLVKTIQNLISYDANEYWGLEEFCTQTPNVYTVDSTHSYLVAEPGVFQVAAAIND